MPWPRLAFLLNQGGNKACRVEGGKRAAEGARKKKQKREKEAKSAAAAAPEEGSESDKKPLGRPPGRKDAAKRVRRTEAEQQRDAAVTAGLEMHWAAPGRLRSPNSSFWTAGSREEERKQLFVAALFASFVCCSQMTNRSLRFINAVYLKKETEKGGGAAAAAERKRQGSSSKGSICADTQTGKQQQQQVQQMQQMQQQQMQQVQQQQMQMQSSNAAAANVATMILITHCP